MLMDGLSGAEQTTYHLEKVSSRPPLKPMVIDHSDGSDSVYSKYAGMQISSIMLPKENIMSIDIPQEFESFVTSLVARRRFLSEHEVLTESLRLLQARESLAEEIQKGFEQIDAGQFVDGPSAFEKLRRRLGEESNS